jgi:hypothetical protein
MQVSGATGLAYGTETSFFNSMSLPLGVKFDTKGELWPLGWMFTPSFIPGVNTLFSLEE